MRMTIFANRAEERGFHEDTVKITIEIRKLSVYEAVRIVTISAVQSLPNNSLENGRLLGRFNHPSRRTTN